MLDPALTETSLCRYARAESRSLRYSSKASRQMAGSVKTFCSAKTPQPFNRPIEDAGQLRAQLLSEFRIPSFDRNTDVERQDDQPTPEAARLIPEAGQGVIR